MNVIEQRSQLNGFSETWDHLDWKRMEVQFSNCTNLTMIGYLPVSSDIALYGKSFVTNITRIGTFA